MRHIDGCVSLNINTLKSPIVFPHSQSCVPWLPALDIQYIRCYIKQCSINLPASVTLLHVSSCVQITELHSIGKIELYKFVSIKSDTGSSYICITDPRS